MPLPLQKEMPVFASQALPLSLPLSLSLLSEEKAPIF